MCALPLEQEAQAPLYERIADRLTEMIRAGTYAPGERVPSVRKASAQFSVSVSTVIEAYRRLEDRQLIEARPQSGYYVRALPESPPEPMRTETMDDPMGLEVGDLVMRVVREASREELVRLGAATPAAEFYPTQRLNRMLAQAGRHYPDDCLTYGSVPGSPALRREIARRMLDAGASVAAPDLLVTAGAQEAVNLCLRAVTKPGDTVIIETPTYYGLLESIELLNLKALEIATDPRTGICLDDVEKELKRNRVAALLLVPTYGNPLGHVMDDDAKQRLVALLKRHEVPLVEDDVYGELTHGDRRPHAVKAFDDSGLVLYCSSFSKTLAPGYRVGWAAPGRYRREVERLKFSSSVSSATPNQIAVATFLERGGFDRYLRRLRRIYRDNCARMAATVAAAFPDGTRITRPTGGHVLWVELPRHVDSLDLHERALTRGVSIAPGPIFSASGQYSHFVRLNCAVPWSDEVEAAVHTLGELTAP